MTNWLDQMDGVVDYDHSSGGRPRFPIVQWSHKGRSMLAEVDGLGSFGMVLSWPTDEATFGSGAKSTKKLCYMTDQADFCILALRERWFMRGTEEEVSGYVDGAYSKLHVLCIPRDADEPAPVVLTLKASAAGTFRKQYGAYKRTVLQPAGRLAGRDLSPSAFWLTIRVGPPQWVGTGANQVETTPPELVLPPAGADLLTWLGERFVGEFVIARSKSIAGEIEAWIGEDPKPHEPTQAPDRAAGHPQNGTASSVPVGNDSQHPEPKPDEFDNLPSASAEPGMQKVLFYSRVKTLGLENSAAVRAHADKAEASGDWGGALVFLNLLATN